MKIRTLVVAALLCLAPSGAQAQPTAARAATAAPLDPLSATKWGVLGQLAGTSWQFGAEGFATYQWAKPGRTLIGTVRTWSGTYQTVYVLNDDGTLTGGRKLTETGETGDVALTIAADRFAATGGNLRYSCKLSRQALACTDEVSNDGKRFVARQALTGSAVSADQIAQMTSVIPTGFPDWTPGTFDARFGAFEGLSDKVWISNSNDGWREVRFKISNYAERSYVEFGAFNLVGDPTEFLSILSEGNSPLHAIAHDSSISKVGQYSQNGDARIVVNGNLWRFSLTPNHQTAMLEIYRGEKINPINISLRKIYFIRSPVETEIHKWRIFSKLFNNTYDNLSDRYTSFRLIDSEKMLITNYRAYGTNYVSGGEPYNMSYCILDISTQGQFPQTSTCIGKGADRSEKMISISDITENSMNYNGVILTLKLINGHYYLVDSNNNNKFIPSDWTQVASSKIAYYEWRSQTQAYNERVEREHQQQAEMQSLYNSLSLLANRSMANAGMTGTTFTQARTDWSASGAPAPLPYDAGGVYGQRTVDGGYYVGNGLSSKEIERYQARQQSAPADNQPSAAPPGGEPNYGAIVTTDAAATPTQRVQSASGSGTQTANGGGKPTLGASAARPAMETPKTYRSTGERTYYFGDSANPYSQEGQWKPVSTFMGVTVEAMYRRELSYQVIAQIKLVNTTRKTLTIGVTPAYQCYNTEITKPGGASTLTLGPGQVALGQNAGLYDYPCKGEYPLVRIGYASLAVTEVR
jgi:hypothetical protein